MKRIGIYGGTFNPPHVGHIRAAQYALTALNLDKLLIIPSCIAPHKQLPEDSATPSQRLRMLQLCFGQTEKIVISDLELQRGGTSYTYETVQQIKTCYPEDELVLFMGTDMFLSFLSWRKPEIILQHVSIGVFYRGQRGENTAVDQQKALLEEMGAKVYIVDNPVTEIASSDLRRLLHFDCAQDFLPAGVAEYIHKENLYNVQYSLKDLSEKELEQAVKSLIKPSRVAHVLGCRDTAVELAHIWGANDKDAERAALLHDITKALDGPCQLTLCRRYGIVLDDFFRKNPKVLHAVTGSAVAQWIFGENPAVVAAIGSHTTGKGQMNMLEKIIYVADYMEPNRAFAGVEEMRRLARTDINRALKMGLQMTAELLQSQGRVISPASLQALADLEKI